MPADFRDSVRRRLARRRLWNELRLVFATGFFTGAVLTFVFAFALGLDWWHRLMSALSPSALLDYLRLMPPRVAACLGGLEAVERGIKGILPFLPLALLAAALGALILEVAILRCLRLGPFSTPQQNTL